MGVHFGDHNLLLTALAEELKVPLIQIARESELLELSSMQNRSEMAMKLIDSYILGLQSYNQTSLMLEPLNISSVLYDVAHDLSKSAVQQGYVVDLDVDGTYGPIMGDRTYLQSAFTALGYELMQIPEEDIKPVLTFATQKRNGLVSAGIFMNNASLTADAFRRARALVGTARQIMPIGPTSNGAGIFIADALLNGMASPLKITRHNKQSGIAATFIPSRQLQII